ncbi:hypothetical protein [Vulcanisaeta sp. JCM 16159]|nr:hypothetical protein [Vulcanisaeta sp. JCM 16159]
MEDVVNAVRRPNVFVADPVMPEGVGFIVDHEIGGSVDGVYIRRGGFGA